MGAGGETAATGGSMDIVAILAVAAIWLALFCWLAVVGWAKHRRLEREAYYHHETEKRLLEKGDAGAVQILRLRNEEQRVRWLQRREGLKLGGLIVTALGMGILVGLQFIDTGGLSFAGAGWVPLIIGLALLLYVYVLHPKTTNLSSDLPPLPPGERKGDPHN